MEIDEIFKRTCEFRLQGKHVEAWAYYLKGIEHNDFTCDEKWARLFAYEKSILAFYIGIPKEEALRDFMVSYSLYKNIEYSNLQYYVIPFPSVSSYALPAPVMDDFIPSSTACIRLGGRILLNVRYVNYRLQENGSYLMSENGVLSPHHHIRTRNFYMLTDPTFTTFSDIREMVVREEPRHSRNIHGLEDIRLFTKGQDLYFSATTCEYSHNGNIQEVQGRYDLQEGSFLNIEAMQSPRNAHVEKNWIPLQQGYEASVSKFIYTWYPFLIGSVHDGHLQFEGAASALEEKGNDAPYFFKHVRGSSTLVSHESHLYTMVHCVIETCPRKYYHMLVKLNPETYSLVSYTVPYYFVKNHIEYTLGIDIQGSTLTCIASQNDCNPIIVKMDMNSLIWL